MKSMRAPIGQQPAVVLQIRRDPGGRLSRLILAGALIVTWLGFAVLDAIFSFMMFFSEPNTVEVLAYTSPLLAPIPWILQMAHAKGRIVVYPDHVEIRHRRLFSRPIFLSREEVAKVVIDAGSGLSSGRFPTGDPDFPLLWPGPDYGESRPTLPTITDGFSPNLALILTSPIPMSMARHHLSAVPVGGPPGSEPPRRNALADALLFAVEDLNAARTAFAAWPVDEPLHSVGVSAPESVEGRIAAASMALLGLSLLTGIALTEAPVIAPFAFAGCVLVMARAVYAQRMAT